MRKLLLSSLLASTIIIGKAQTIIDTVSVGNGYANQVWYSLTNDNQASVAKNNWDLAFDASGFGSSILINSVSLTTLWGHPTKDTSGWATLDTVGISTWKKRSNSDTSWAYGAFNNYANPANPLDLDWGIYNTTTHIVTGDSLYVIKLGSGAYKKLWIKSLASGTYTFRYANLDGSSDTTVQIAKSGYSTKAFAYYSIQNKVTLDREPAKTSWDLLFGQYTNILPGFGPYTVTGILQNSSVRVAKVDTVGNTTTYSNWSAHTFKTAVNGIGYDWKTFTGGTYIIKDSLVFFAKTNATDVWKIICMGFGGSSTGNFIFSKEKLDGVGINDNNGNKIASISVFPNPSNGNNITLLYNIENSVSSAILTVYDLSGRIVLSEKLNTTAGLYTHTLNTSTINAGMYMVSLNVDGSVIQQKLIIE